MKTYFLLIFSILLLGCSKPKKTNTLDIAFFEQELEFLIYENRKLEMDVFLLGAWEDYSITPDIEELNLIRKRLNAIKRKIENKEISTSQLIQEFDRKAFLKYIPQNMLPTNYPSELSLETTSDSLFQQVVFERYHRVILKNAIGKSIGCASLTKPKISLLKNENGIAMTFGITDSNFNKGVIIDSVFVNSKKLEKIPELNSTGEFTFIPMQTNKPIEIYGKYVIQKAGGGEIIIPIHERTK